MMPAKDVPKKASCARRSQIIAAHTRFGVTLKHPPRTAFKAALEISKSRTA
jgi:hypothetical protein